MSPGKSPAAINARNKLWSEVWAGRLERKKTCEQCGKTPDLWGRQSRLGELDAHHDDYEKPLEVRWLCRSCHARHHAAIRLAAKRAQAAA